MCAKNKSTKVALECNDCGRRFRKTMSLHTFIVQCPNCDSEDIQPVTFIRKVKRCENCGQMIQKKYKFCDEQCAVAYRQGEVILR